MMDRDSHTAAGTLINCQLCSHDCDDGEDDSGETLRAILANNEQGILQLTVALLLQQRLAVTCEPGSNGTPQSMKA